MRAETVSSLKECSHFTLHIAISMLWGIKFKYPRAIQTGPLNRYGTKEGGFGEVTFLNRFFFTTLLRYIQLNSRSLKWLVLIYVHSNEAITTNSIVSSHPFKKFLMPACNLLLFIHPDPRYFPEFYIYHTVYIFCVRLFRSAYIWDSSMLMSQ